MLRQINNNNNKILNKTSIAVIGINILIIVLIIILIKIHINSNHNNHNHRKIKKITAITHQINKNLLKTLMAISTIIILLKKKNYINIIKK